MNPAVHADLVAAALENRRDHLRVEQVAHRRDEERRRHLVLVEQPQDARQPVDRAVLAARDRFRNQVAGGEIGRRVVDVEAEADGDARAVGPRRRLEALAGADVEHLRLDLRQRQPHARLRSGRLGDERRRRRQHGEAESAIRVPRSAWSCVEHSVISSQKVDRDDDEQDAVDRDDERRADETSRGSRSTGCRAACRRGTRACRCSSRGRASRSARSAGRAT